MKYDAVICDLGNVLMDFDHKIAVKKLLSVTPKSEKDIYDLFFDSPLTELYETGKISTGEFFKRVKEELLLKINLGLFLPIWNEIFFESPRNAGMRHLLGKIKRRYKLIMLSNTNITHYEHLKNTTPAFSLFDRHVLSYEVGHRKPAPEIYAHALKTMEISPEKVFYIDDRPDLIKAASDIGIKGLVFDGERALKKLGEIL